MLNALMLLLSIAFAVIPMVLFLGVVWWLDRYDREPIWLVGLSFGWGAIGAILFALVGSLIFSLPIEAVLDPTAADAVTATFVAPLVEEPSKALFLLLVVLSRHFDNTTDGFVYGAAIGLGFGMTENFLYFSDVASTGDVWAWVGTVAIRTLYSALMHACATSVVGATLGFSKFRGWGWKLLLPPVGLAVAMGIHALWNGLLSIEGFLEAGGELALLNFLLFPLEFLGLFVTMQVCLWTEKVTLRQELEEEAKRGVLPPSHVHILSSTWQRSRRGWLHGRINQRDYVKTATQLAMRKHQARNRPILDKQVQELRARLVELQRASAV